MQGRSLNIDPVVVLLALAFWGVIWGIPGMVLSTPLTVVTMAVLAQFPGTRWIAVMLSSDGDPLGEPSCGRDQGPRAGQGRAADSQDAKNLLVGALAFGAISTYLKFVRGFPSLGRDGSALRRRCSFPDSEGDLVVPPRDESRAAGWIILRRRSLFWGAKSA